MNELTIENFDTLELKDLELLNGGAQDDYEFGYKVGNTIRWLGKELWYNTFGFRPVY